MFQSTDNYIATRELQIAVNASIHLQKPLLVKGEPGTGKTLLAHEIAKSLGKKLITWHIKSTTTAQQGLYEYDAVARLRDSQLGNPNVENIAHYIKKGKLWQAFEGSLKDGIDANIGEKNKEVDVENVVLLIDEIDKADIEFPNDLLLELDKMEFFVYETQQTITAIKRPIIIITSNNEKELPDAFLRRCFFYYIPFPEPATMHDIVKVHFGDLGNALIDDAMRVFYQVREVKGLKKKPSTSELIDWIKLLKYGQIPFQNLSNTDIQTQTPPYIGALLKNEQDLTIFERLRRMGR